MRSGKLDRTIALQNFAKTVNEFGTPVETWTTYATVRAELLEETAEEFRASYGDRDEALTMWRIRYRDDVTTKHRVAYDGQTFEVREIGTMGRRKYLELRCVEVRP